MEFRVIIPARFSSTRLPGKMLVDIAGKPMVQHVYERAVNSGAESVVIATDDERVAKAAEKFGAPVCMTASDHQSGTERLSEAVTALEYDPDEIVVCVQGDEPLLSAEYIRMVAEDLAEHDNVKITSLCDPIDEYEELMDPNVVKVVLNHRNYAMFFSRAPIPWEMTNFNGNKKDHKLMGQHYRHVSLYAYRASFLMDYMEWGPCPVESMESLEQLRILWNGGRIHMRVAPKKLPPSVDTDSDLKVVREMAAVTKK